MAVLWKLCFTFLVLHRVSGEMTPEFVFQALSGRLDRILTARYTDVRRLVDEFVGDKIQLLEQTVKQVKEVYESRVEQIETDVNKIHANFESKIEYIERSVSKVNEEMEDRMEKLERSVSEISKVNEEMKGRMGEMEHRVTKTNENVEDRIDKLQHNVNQTIENKERESELKTADLNTEMTAFKQRMEIQYNTDVNTRAKEVDSFLKNVLRKHAFTTRSFISAEKSFLRGMMERSFSEAMSDYKKVMSELSSFNKTLSSSEQRLSNAMANMKSQLLEQYEEMENNSKLQQLKILDTVDALETTVSETKQEISTGTSADMKRYINQCNAKYEATNLNVARLDRKVSNEVGSLRSKINDKHQMVGFTARLRHTGLEYGKGEVIKFNDITFDSKGSYDKKTGIFTAPVGGLYLFIYHIENVKDKTCHVIMCKNGSCLSEALAARHYHAMGGNAVTLTLQKGDRVWIQTARLRTEYAVVDHSRTTFTGILIQPA